MENLLALLLLKLRIETWTLLLFLSHPPEDANLVVDEDADREGEYSDDLTSVDGDADMTTNEDLDNALDDSTLCVPYPSGFCLIAFCFPLSFRDKKGENLWF